jgi:hypothetical protein
MITTKVDHDVTPRDLLGIFFFFLGGGGGGGGVSIGIDRMLKPIKLYLQELSKP